VFKFEIVKKQKGYILLYTLILSFLCMLIVMLGFKLIIDEKEISTLITAHVTPINREAIKNYFSVNSENPIVAYERSYIKYNKDKDSLVLTYEYKEGFLKRDEYAYDVVNGLITYTYKNSVYESGRII